MQLRKFKSSDHDQLVDFWKRAFPEDPPHNAPEKIIPAKLDVDDLIFIAEENETIIGACMAGYDGHRGWLYAVAVDPQHRRANLGSKLVNFTLDALKQKGCIKVNLQIRANNQAVEGFYQSLGFETEPRISMGKFL